MNKVFITGGAGFIGSHLAEELINKGYNVRVFDNLHAGTLDNISHLSLDFVRGDILNYGSLSDAMRNCDFVLHFAALTNVNESMHMMDEYISVNLHGTLNVLKAAKEHGIKKVVYASSAAVYGDLPGLAAEEEMYLTPKSPYAITKVEGEYYCNFYSDNYSLPTACARFFNVFGERQNTASTYAAAIPLFILKCINNNPIAIYGDGTQVRDFIYIKDLVKAVLLIMQKGTGTFNIGYGKTVDINTLVKQIKNYLNSTSILYYAAERKGEIKYSCSSIRKLASLGFIPDFSLENGLHRTIKYFLH